MIEEDETREMLARYPYSKTGLSKISGLSIQWINSLIADFTITQYGVFNGKREVRRYDNEALETCIKARLLLSSGQILYTKQSTIKPFKEDDLVIGTGWLSAKHVEVLQEKYGERGDKDWNPKWDWFPNWLERENLSTDELEEMAVRVLVRSFIQGYVWNSQPESAEDIARLLEHQRQMRGRRETWIAHHQKRHPLYPPTQESGNFEGLYGFLTGAGARIFPAYKTESDIHFFELVDRENHFQRVETLDLKRHRIDKDIDKFIEGG